MEVYIILYFIFKMLTNQEIALEENISGLVDGQKVHGREKQDENDMNTVVKL